MEYTPIKLTVAFIHAKLNNIDLDLIPQKGNYIISDPYGGIFYMSDFQLHRTDGPAVTNNGAKCWYQNDKLHREDGPAIEFDSGTKEWWLNGKMHREGGPAIIRTDGYREWRMHGNRHRIDGPAIISEYGTKHWYLNNKFHRENGPALDGASVKAWYINGKLHREGDKPAYVDSSGYSYVKNNNLHRLNGPAEIFLKEQLELTEDEILKISKNETSFLDVDRIDSVYFCINNKDLNPIEYMEHPLVSEETVEDVVMNWIMYWKDC